ncbi:hypothetical protein [Paenibacillus oceani]|uniref:Uncharacterized protein n=1 Tax=Paenibacillus oceani TaxID=2772510 RepID=A0A927GY51_9BACL|nr:hypothetical protein [Paenibacillus oceani]MBD2860672.1 hypothetical protein [Paenibacillus oceani]
MIRFLNQKGEQIVAWQEVVRRFAPLLYVGGRVVLVGDGVKQVKEDGISRA